MDLCCDLVCEDLCCEDLCCEDLSFSRWSTPGAAMIPDPWLLLSAISPPASRAASRRHHQDVRKRACEEKGDM